MFAEPLRTGRAGNSLLCGALALSALACAEPDRIVFEREGAVVLEVEVRLAVDEAARRRGLRETEALGVDEGLLIQFPAASEVCIVNEGVTFPIDVVYAEGGRVGVVETAVPAGDASAPRSERGACERGSGRRFAGLSLSFR